MKKILLFLILLFLGGCASYHAKLEKPAEYLNKVTNSKHSSDKPMLGIALSGGGSKAAPFAMGVLKRFVDKGWLDDVDIISSVSGGGYSAYYLYNKAIYLDKHRGSGISLKSFFYNCELDQAEVRGSNTLNEYKEALNAPKCTNYGKHQRHVKKYQDLLSFFSSESNRDASDLDNIRAVGTVTLGLTASLALTPFHHVANTSFDWKWELSPTQWLYKSGIDRAYRDHYDKKIRNNTFEDLKTITEKHTVPLWIINASNFGENWLVGEKSDTSNLDKSIFEITPYGFGSGKKGLGYSMDSPSNLSLDLSRATLASAAFFDALGGSKLAFGTLHAFNLRWGIKIPRYNTSISDQNLHSFIPFPLYYFDMELSKITLADGGQSGDNLGLYSLIKRGVRNIVVVSGSHDMKSGKLKLEDICRVANFVSEFKGMTVEFEGNPDEIKNEDDAKKLINHSYFCNKSKVKYSYLEWKRPIWKAHVKKGKHEVSKLFFIKAAIDGEDFTKHAKAFENKKHENYQGLYKRNYPNSLLAFWIDKEFGSKANDFPQSKTVFDTLNGSQMIYQAYMDLGFYLSGYLESDDDFKKIVNELHN